VLVVLLHRSAVFGTLLLSTAHCFAGCTLWVAVYCSGLCLPSRDPRISETTLGDAPAWWWSWESVAVRPPLSTSIRRRGRNSGGPAPA